MLISVVVPTRNRPARLLHALRSVLGQTYQNLEIIVVDDSSEDATREALLEVADPRLEYLRNDEALGAASARNAGIKQAKGELVAFLDDDDEWLPTKLEKQAALFAGDKDIGLVYTQVVLSYPELGLQYTTNPSLRGYVFRELLKENAIGVTPAVAVRRAALDSAGLFDPSFPAREEYDLWLRVSRDWKVDYVDEPLTVSNQEPNLERISSAVEPYEKAIARLNEKYVDALACLTPAERRARLAAQEFFVGAQAMKAGNLTKCRAALVRSLRTRPSCRTALALAASLGGIRGMVLARRLSSRVSELVTR